MAFLRFNNVGITGMAAAVPANVIDNYKYTAFFPEEAVKEIVDKVGIKQRRFVDEKTCSSDLCFAAAERLLSDMQIDRQEIDLLIFVSQTPDYRMPATSILLQHRLGLGKHTMAFDISLGCSGFVYGLSTVFSYMQAAGLRKALLLDGETRSRIYSPKDRKTAFLFGDGGIAALIEPDPKFGPSFFSLHSDGSLENLIKINAGGYRNISTADTLQERVVDEHGNIRTDEHGYMDGGEVFNFVLREIPSNIHELLAASGTEKSEIDFFVFHQANDFMNSYLARKLKLPKEKVPSTIEKFGNTSSVSIPLTIVSELKDQLIEPRKLLLSGFGVGVSWASAVLNFQDCFISEIVEI
jgi:3-oxoacyl-[acyl-carrier-protein] synthase III